MYICNVCGKEWKDTEAEENELFCSRRCGGVLAKIADQATGAGLPAFIAYAVRDFQNETHPTARLWSICDLTELLLRLIVTIKSSELLKAGRLDEAVARELAGRIEAPTMGKWRGMAEALFKVKLESEFCPELRILFTEMIVPLLDGVVKAGATEESSLAKLRNLLAHGGGITVKTAEKLLKTWVPRIRELIEKLAFFAGYDLVAIQDGHAWILKGTGEKVPWGNSSTGDTKDGLYWSNSLGTLSLEPLAAFGKPLAVDPEFSVTGEAAQIYTRRGEISLEYLPVGSDEVSLSLSTQGKLDSFLDIFKLKHSTKNESVVTSFQIAGFEKDMLKEADQHVGRERELEHLESVLAERKLPVFWVSGPAGIGKSFFISAFTARLWEKQSEAVILPYRFKSSDQRCIRSSFVQFAFERLRQAFPETGQSDEEDSSSGDKMSPKERKPEEALKLLVSRLSGKPVVFVLDGLDELAEKDPQFVRDIVFGLENELLTWVCSSRSERGLEQIFTPDTTVVVFPDGLPPMQENDIRAMILQRIGPLRKQLVKKDQEQGEQVINPFVTKVTLAADGLPLYVRYVIEDILNNKYRSFDTGEKLPPTLAAYHEELLRRCSIGTLQKILTPLVCLLAVAKQALTAGELVRFFIESGLIEDTPSWRDTMEKGLRAIGSMLRRIETPDGTVGFNLYHHSLRQHILASERTRDECTLLRHQVCDLSIKSHDHELSSYLYRWAITHLIDENKTAEALTLAGSFPFWMERLRKTPHQSETEAALQDWKLLRLLVPKDDRTMRLWEAFFRERAHILRRGNDEWPSYKILLHLAVEHADDSPVTIGAEQWLAEGKCDWQWIRRKQRVDKAGIDPCVAVMEGHTGEVYRALLRPDGSILSESADGSLLLWNTAGGFLKKMKGHTSFLNGALLRHDGSILSWSGDGTLRLWSADGEPLKVLEVHRDSVREAILCSDDSFFSWVYYSSSIEHWSFEGILLKKLEGHTDVVNGALLCFDGSILSWSDDTTLRLWSFEGEILKVMEGHTDVVNGALVRQDGSILSWADDSTLRLWSAEGELLKILEGHTKSINGALVRQDGSILSWSYDETLRLWSAEGEALKVLEGHTESINGALVRQDGNILSWSYDDTLRLWSAEGEALKVLEGHTKSINGALVRHDGSILSWSSDKTLKLWSSEGELIQILNGHTLLVLGALLIDDDSILSWSGDKTLRLWNLARESKIVLEGHTGEVSKTLCCFNNSILSWAGHWSGGDNNLRLWNFQGELLKVLEGHTNVVNGALLRPDSSILSWSNDGTLRLWSPLGEQMKVLDVHRDVEVYGALLRFDGSILSWSGSYFDLNNLCLWSAKGDLRKVLRGHSYRITGALCRSDNSMLSWSEDKTLRLWSPEGELLKVLRGHTEQINGALLCADGSILSWSDDMTLRLWTSNGKFLKILKGHTGKVTGALCRYDSSLLSWSEDGTIRFWSPKGQPLKVLEGHNEQIIGVLQGANDSVLSWSWDKYYQNRILCVWSPLGTLLEILSFIDAQRNYLELTNINAVSGQFFSFHAGPRIALVNRIQNTESYWEGNNDCTAHHLFPDGRMVATQDNGQVCFLQLYEGNQAIDLERKPIILE